MNLCINQAVDNVIRQIGSGDKFSKDLAKLSLGVRRLIFLNMLAYAEYPIRQPRNPAERFIGFGERVDMAMAEAQEKNIHCTLEQAMEAFVKMGNETKKKPLKNIEQWPIEMPHKNKNMEPWLDWRVANLKDQVTYFNDIAVIPDKESLGKTVTSMCVGDEISYDIFGLVTDAKRLLGEKREDFGY